MSSYMLTFALLRDSSDLHIYKDLYGERNKPEQKKTKNYRWNTVKTAYLNTSAAFFVYCVMFKLIYSGLV